MKDSDSQEKCPERSNKSIKTTSSNIVAGKKKILLKSSSQNRTLNDYINKKNSQIRRLEDTICDQVEHIDELNKQVNVYKKSINDMNEIINGLKESREKLVRCEKLAALGRFTADVAHEIRNPLTAVGGFARRLLKRLSTDCREKEYAEIIVSEVSRLEKILKDVLTFSRDITPKLEKHNVRDLIEESISFYSHICKDQDIKVEKSFEDVPRVLLDKAQIRQAIDNIISNALDAMPKGGTLTVSLGTQHYHEILYVVIRFKDTGEGIEKEKLETIFEPFVTTKEIGHGTGLGLPISRKIMEEHGGLIRCSSEV
ncbi:integral membrane sensor signal transduction histidine kinase, partial [Candidatus Magnetoovum chiemensis]